MTLNNWKMIAETRSDIFRWRSRFRRRCVCLCSLLILPYERPTGPGLTWKTIWIAIEGRHCMEPASRELISYKYSIPTFPFSRAIDVRQLTFSPTTFFEIAIYPWNTVCQCFQTDVTNTGNGERGTGNRSLGTNVQRQPAWEFKMAVKTKERLEEKQFG